MTNDDIIKSATVLSGEQPATNGDYLSRSYSLLALIYNQCAALDKLYRKVNDLPESTWVPVAQVSSLSAACPLSDVFFSAVSFGLASFFVMDENPELSKQFGALYLAKLTEIRQMIPAVLEPIVDRYHLN